MSNVFSQIQLNKRLNFFLKIFTLKKKSNYDLTEYEEANNFIKAVEGAKQNLESIRQLFDNTNDPDIIEYAIYEEYAAKLKLSYLLKKAKDKNIKANNITAIDT